MAWRIGDQVLRGELDNRINGKVTGTIWLLGQDEPLHFDLRGNPWKDWAGCVLRFSQTQAKPGDLTGLAAEQIGMCGDMTASRKVRIPPEPIREWLEKGAPGKDSLPWGNCVYLEWFSGCNGRVVIESTHYSVDISEPAWRMTEEEELEQRKQNALEMGRFMTQLQSAMEEGATDTEDERSDKSKGCPPDPQTDQRESERNLRLISEISDMKRKARELGGDAMIEGPVDQRLPLETEHQFWQNVLAFESAPRKRRRDLLADDGFIPPAPAGLSDAEIRQHLWSVIEALARRRTFLEDTNHLSDRELYTLLVEQVLEEETEVLPPEAEFDYHLPMAEYDAPNGENSTMVYLRYYADEQTRQEWAQDIPEELPPHCDPPYDRDRHLPQSPA